MLAPPAGEWLYK